MTKSEFLSALELRLAGLPGTERQESLEYYSEMIDDRMDDGLGEEAAVAAIGNVDEIVGGILADVPLAKLVKEKVMPRRRMSVWEVVLLVLGAPLWLSLVLALVMLVLACYLVLWSAVVTIYAVSVSLGIGGIAGIAGIVFFAMKGEAVAGLLLLGIGCICAGLAILIFLLGNRAAKGVIALGKVTAVGTKRLFVGKKAAK